MHNRTIKSIGPCVLRGIDIEGCLFGKNSSQALSDNGFTIVLLGKASHAETEAQDQQAYYFVFHDDLIGR